MSLFVSILTSMQHLCVGKSIGSLDMPVCLWDPAMRSMLSANRRDFVPPFDWNGVNEVFMMHRLDLHQENQKAWRL